MGILLKVNKKFEHVLVYKFDELEGKSFLSLIHEDDIPSTVNAIKKLEEQKSTYMVDEVNIQHMLDTDVQFSPYIKNKNIFM